MCTPLLASENPYKEDEKRCCSKLAGVLLTRENKMVAFGQVLGVFIYFFLALA